MASLRKTVNEYKERLKDGSMKEFTLRECYILAIYGLRATINAGKLEGFSEEEEDEIQKDTAQKVRMVRESV